MAYGVPSIGATLDERYVVERVVGAGAHGVVVAVTRKPDGARLALKILDPSSGDPRRLEREARVLARVDHPAVVRLFETGRLEAGRLYVALELVEGRTLADVLARDGALEPAEALSVMRDVAGALAAAHAAGVVHRDLHPGNVMLVGGAPRRSAKVLDFGVAAFAEDARLTPSGASAGTVAYMAPEQLAGDTTAQSDLYAWGLVLLECLLGRPVVTGKSFYEVAFKHLREDAVPMPPALLEHPLGRLVARALAKKLDARLASAAELVAALATIDVAGLLLTGAPRSTVRAHEAPPSSAPLSPLGSGLERRHVTVVAVEPGDAPPAALLAWLRDEVAALGGHADVGHDGSLLAVFGVPVAREDDATRAAQAALALVASPRGASPTPRVALASGVVIADPSSPAATLAAARRSPLVASAVELARAAPRGAVLAQESTALLLRARFHCDPVVALTDATVYRVLRAYAVPLRASARALVGRDRELQALRRQWREARAGRSSAAIVVGEAGIGKSRLLEALGEACRADGGYWVDCACSPHAENTPLHPLLQRARAAADIAPGDDVVTARRKLVARGVASALGGEAELGLLAELLVDRLESDAGAGEERLGALASLVSTRTGAPPTLITVEDAGWCDPSTLALLSAAVARPGARVLVVLTARGELALPGALANAEEIVLGRLAPAHAAEVARHAATGALSDAEVDAVVTAADGVPLFVEELARTAHPGALFAAGASIPVTIRGLFAARLDDLGEARRTAQLAALAGHEVRLDVLIAVAPWGAALLEADLDAMLRHGLVYQRGVPPSASYQFVHHVAREVAHDSILPEVRRSWHGALADALVARFGALAEAQPEAIARHFAEARRPLEAARWAERAGRLAFSRSASFEARRHFLFALDELDAVAPSSTREALELASLRGLSSAVGATEGMASPDAESALRRQHALHVARGERGQAFVVERMLGTQQVIRAHLAGALADAERALDESVQLRNPAAEGTARVQRGLALFAGARFVEADADLARAVELIDRAPSLAPELPRAIDPRVLARCFRARALAHLGAVDRALVVAEQNIAAARSASAPHGETIARNGLLQVHQMRRDAAAAEAALESLVLCAGSHPAPSLAAFLDLSRAWIASQRGEDRVAPVLDAVDRFRASGMSIDATLLCAMTADACVAVGRVEDGLAAVARGLALAAELGELHAEPELYRLRASLLDLRQGAGGEDAREALETAASLAAVSGARAVALRVACDLARWHLVRGDRDAARDVLAPELAAVVEGEGTIDVVDARALAALLA